MGGGRVQEEHDMVLGGGRYSCCKRGADRRGVCDWLIGAFHGGGGGYAKVHILLHLLHLRILVCAAFFEFILYFLCDNFLVVRGGWWVVVVLPFYGWCPLFC